jgi:hypothetical protein
VHACNLPVETVSPPRPGEGLVLGLYTNTICRAGAYAQPPRPAGYPQAGAPSAQPPQGSAFPPAPQQNGYAPQQGQQGGYGAPPPQGGQPGAYPQQGGGQQPPTYPGQQPGGYGAPQQPQYGQQARSWLSRTPPGTLQRSCVHRKSSIFSWLLPRSKLCRRHQSQAAYGAQPSSFLPVTSQPRCQGFSTMY